MKRLLSILFLLVSAAPLFANDEGGEIAYVPSYRELIREGYGPRYDEYGDDYRRAYQLQAVAKPTQAYYGKGFTVYYGYKAVPVRSTDTSLVYAFGYPVAYFRHMMPGSINDTNLEQYAIEVRKPHSLYAPGDFVAQARAAHAYATSTVQAATQSTKSNAANTANAANPLPPIGEKPLH